MQIFIILFILSTALFRSYPQIDIKIAQFMESLMNNNALDKYDIEMLESCIWLYSVALCSSAATIFILNLHKDYLEEKKIIKKIIMKFIQEIDKYLSQIYVISSVFIVPVAFIHCISKILFHRPRPIDIIEFGGQMKFTKPWDIAGQCTDHCSFPSSHAAMGYVLYTLFWIAFYHKDHIIKINSSFSIRRSVAATAIFVLATIIGIIFGAVRMLQGMHFLSDIVFSGFITFAGTWLIFIILNKASKSLPY